jgi:hypothetical protein
LIFIYEYDRMSSMAIAGCIRRPSESLKGCVERLSQSEKPLGCTGKGLLLIAGQCDHIKIGVKSTLEKTPEPKSEGKKEDPKAEKPKEEAKK